MITLVLTLLTVLVITVETGTIDQFARLADDPATTDEQRQALPGTLVHSTGGLIVLLIVFV